MIERLLTEFEREVIDENSRANRWARRIMLFSIILLFLMVAAKFVGGLW